MTGRRCSCWGCRGGRRAAQAVFLVAFYAMNWAVSEAVYQTFSPMLVIWWNWNGR